MPLMLYFFPSSNLKPGAAAGAEIANEGAAAAAGAAAAGVGAAWAGDVAAGAADSGAAWPKALQVPVKDDTVKRHATIEKDVNEIGRLFEVIVAAFDGVVFVWVHAMVDAICGRARC